METIQLGDVVRDKLTGYEGTAIGVTKYLSNVDRFTIQPCAGLVNGKPVESRTLDLMSLEFVSRGSHRVWPPQRGIGNPALGDVVRDDTTGVEGTMIAFTIWSNGCVRCQIQPRELKDGAPVDTVHVDEKDVTVLTRLNPPAPEVTTGGPRVEPSRR